MKRLLMLTVLICGLFSVAKAQVAAPSGWCIGCSDAQRDHDWEMAQHNQWPTRVRFTRPNKTYYGELTAKFEFANNTNKEIKQVTWEFILVSLTTGQPIASYTVVTNKSIAPQSTAVLSKKVKVPLESFYTSPTGAGSGTVPGSETFWDHGWRSPLGLPFSLTGKSPSYDLPDVVQAEQFSQAKQIKYRDGSIGTP